MTTNLLQPSPLLIETPPPFIFLFPTSNKMSIGTPPPKTLIVFLVFPP